MGSFKDTKGRAWEFAVTIGSMRRVRDKLGIDLYKLAGDNFKDLLGDPVRFCDLMYVLCHGTTNRTNVTSEEFGESWDHDVWITAADSFVKEYARFFLSPTDREKMDLSRNGTLHEAQLAGTSTL